MKTLFIESVRKLDENIDTGEIEKIPGKLHILYSIQYKRLAEKIKEKLGNKVVKIEQVLGCSIINPQATLLLISSGRFHAVNIALTTNKPVYIYNSNKIEKINEKEIEDMKKKQQAKLAKFYASDTIGLLVSTKSGQNKLKEAEKLKQQLESKYPDKKFYLFVAETINLNEIENFPVDIFINFACPGLELDSSKILNYSHFPSLK